MESENNYSKKIQEKKIEELHFDCQKFTSMLRFMEDEILFINRLLNSYVFEPNTPNLFERLQEYQDQLKEVVSRKIKVRNDIAKHENSLGGMLECKDNQCDLGFYNEHKVLKEEVNDLNIFFQSLKTEIFNYAGGNFKKKQVEAIKSNIT